MSVRFLPALVLSCISFFSNASVISYQGYTLNQTNKSVSDGQLEWLQWNQTVGMSISQALSKYASEGWRLASNTDVSQLFNRFRFSDDPLKFGADENKIYFSNQQFNGSIDDIKTDKTLQFIALFGYTFKEGPRGPLDTDPPIYSMAHFGQDLDQDGLFNFAWVIDDYTFPLSYSGTSIIASDSYTADYFMYDSGIALVREVKTNSISNPSTFTIFLLALFLLKCRARLRA